MGINTEQEKFRILRTTTTLGIEKETLKRFKEQKLRFSALIGEEISDDVFLKKLLKSFQKFDLVLSIAEMETE